MKCFQTLPAFPAFDLWLYGTGCMWLVFLTNAISHFSTDRHWSVIGTSAPVLATMPHLRRPPAHRPTRDLQRCRQVVHHPRAITGVGDHGCVCTVPLSPS